MTFTSKLRRAQELTSSVLCVGLDPDPERLPEPLLSLPTGDAVRQFCSAIVASTKDLACAYKPNLAFFEALGREGLAVLDDVVSGIPDDRVVIADGKRGDIGNTAERYARAAFDELGVDACTVSAYMGRESIIPFLARPGKAAFALVRTSNRSASEVQLLDVAGEPLYKRMAGMLAAWSSTEPGEVGFVVGGTDPSVLTELRDLYPTVPLLIPGVGAQGGDPASIMKAVAHGPGPVIVNASRSILFAGRGTDYAERAREAAAQLRNQLKR